MITIQVNTVRKVILAGLGILIIFGTFIAYLLIAHTWLLHTFSELVALFSVFASAFSLLVARKVSNDYIEQHREQR